MFDLYLHHGRTDPSQDMADWGFVGPRLSGVAGIHMTYATHLHVLFVNAAAMGAAAMATGWEIFDESEYRLRADVVNDLLVCPRFDCSPSYFGDWGLMLNETGKAHALLHAKGPIAAPAPPPAPAAFDPLADLPDALRARLVGEMGFEPEQTGGGCYVLSSRASGGHHVWISCHEGGGLPDADSWMVCAYAPAEMDLPEPFFTMSSDPAHPLPATAIDIFEAASMACSLIAMREGH